MSEQYWVRGGVYTGTDFTTLAPGQKHIDLGPFDTYEEALAVWRGKSMEHIDDAYARFYIQREQHVEYWVVGGIYTDTSFKTIANGGQEVRIGPFASLEDAKIEWKARAMSSVDDACARYRIDSV